MAYNDFDEVVFSPGIPLRGTTGGPSFNTSVLTTQSGKEYRQQNWKFSRGSWDLGGRTLREVETQEIVAFFQARGGMARGFRFKDFSDYKDNGNGRIGRVGNNNVMASTIDGSTFYNMFKQYNSAGQLYYRRIYKPVNNKIIVKKGGVLVPIGMGAGQCQIDYTTGIVRLTPIKRLHIQSIAKDDQGTITTDTAHSLTDGERVGLNVPSVPELHQRSFSIKVQNATKFTIYENTTDYSNYTGDGYAEQDDKGGQALTWEGEFDVPVRFNTDKIDFYFTEIVKYTNAPSAEVFCDLQTLPIVELKL
ncbi:DUF2460 domain-containing protein [Flavobacterium sp.]|jgi:uncharacterized protein (TIGR02217 family)|uniref:DUF2460 domain-containing protein n=1 Tax=Flavobacterium sp. TaxID=239 RepID=UPI0037BEC9AB